MSGVVLFFFASIAGNQLCFADNSFARSSDEWSAQVWDRLLRSAPANARLLHAGDMILPREYVRHARDWLRSGRPRGDSAFDGDVTIWPNGIVYYAFSADITPVHQKAFVDAANDWASFAHVSFVRRTTQPNYLLVENDTGNSSGVGMLGGPQDFKMNAWTRDTLCHELGHALGYVHEHQRSDRDIYVTILTENIVPGDEFAFALLPNSNNRTSYDFLSIMHYARNAFSISPDLDTIEPNAGYTQYIDVMGNTYGRELSVFDRQGMVSVYGAGPMISNVVTNTKDSGLGSFRTAIFFGIDHPGTTITFNIPTSDPGHVGNTWIIKPSDVMTSPGTGTIIDASTQPNGNRRGPSIVIDGSGGPAPDYPMPGFLMQDTNCTLKSVAIVNCQEDGIQILGSGATGNSVLACDIGINADGAAAAPNTYNGIAITNAASGNTIGGSSASLRNVISGNLSAGVSLGVTSSNLILGNYIGTDRTGAFAVPNQYTGISFGPGATSNTVGGTTAGARNVISGNPTGIIMVGPGTNQNVIAGNYIGTNAAGSVALPNNGDGITLFAAPTQNTIGGTTNGSRNVIAGNTGNGITLFDPGTTGNLIAGNYIGTTAAGTAALPNNADGIGIFGVQGNTVGGTSAVARNVISGNTFDGISIAGTGTNLNLVEGNFIGTNAAGTGTIANGFRGITIFGGAQSNMVGGTSAGAGNTISGNTFEGIALFDSGTNFNSIRQNSINNNGDLGIRLATDGGGTPNDLQAAPTLTSAVINGNKITISGNLTSTRNTQFTLEFFSNQTADPSGFGEGQTFLDAIAAKTNNAGTVSFSKAIRATVTSGYAISATATNSAGDTSQFSNDVTSQ